MIKAIKQSKWYWYIPLLYPFFIPQMSKWAFQAEKKIDRDWRMILVIYLMFPTIIVGSYIYIYFNYHGFK